MNYLNKNIKINVRKYLNEYYEKKTKENDFEVFMNDLLSKYDYDDIYLSFRKNISTTKINKNNIYNTPTGIYTYKLSHFFNKNHKFNNVFEIYGNKLIFKFASGYHFLYFYVVKDDVNILSQDTNIKIFDDYVLKIKKLFRNNEEIKNKCDEWFERYTNKDLEEYTCNEFWDFLYIDILKGEKSTEHDGPIGNTNIRFTNLCNKLGIDGFTDKGHGYIHPNEPKQTVFFKPNLFKDIKIYNVRSSWESERKMDALKGSEQEIKLSTNTNDIKKILLKYNDEKSIYKSIARHFSFKGKRELEFYDNVLNDKELGDKFINLIVDNLKTSKYPDKIIDIIIKNGYEKNDELNEYIRKLSIDNPLFEYILFLQSPLKVDIINAISFFYKNKLDLDFFYTYFEPKNYILPDYVISELINDANDSEKMFMFLLPSIKNFKDKKDIIYVAIDLKDKNLGKFLINTELENNALRKLALDRISNNIN